MIKITLNAVDVCDAVDIFFMGMMYIRYVGYKVMVGIQFFYSVKLSMAPREYGINLQDIKLNGLIRLFTLALCRVKHLSL